MVLELSPQGERLIEETGLEGELRHQLKVDSSWPVFVPSRHFDRCGKRVTVHLMEGYAFVASGLDEIHYFRLERSRLVEQVMTTRGPNGVRVLSVVSNAKIEELRRRLLSEVSVDITPGMPIRVTQGLYSNMVGSVELVEGDHAAIYFDLDSLKLVAWLPLAILDTTDQEVRSLPKLVDILMTAPEMESDPMEEFKTWLRAALFPVWLRARCRVIANRSPSFESFLKSFMLKIRLRQRG